MPEEHEYIYKLVQSHTGRSIRKSHLLYKLDLLNKTNFHNYVDGHECILLIIKSLKGNIIGGYSESPFKFGVVANKDGFIFNATNKNCFTLKTNNLRSITYDEFYIIFGNSEIRIKNLDDLLFSNFGISNGHYHPKGNGVSVLLGEENTKEIKVSTYEFHKLIFYWYFTAVGEWVRNWIFILSY